jgi:hypothetical protein
MRYRSYYLVLMVVIMAAAFFCCSRGEKSEKAQEFSLDAGPPPRPLFFDFEGLKWGMIPEEVIAAWGPPAEAPDPDRGYTDMRYSDRASFKNVTLYFITVPAFRNVHEDVKPQGKSDRALMFLFSVSLDPGLDDIKPWQAVRADLVSRFGEPLTEPKIYESRNSSPEHSAIFRAAECTLAVARWAKAEPSVNWPERLDNLQYVLAPDSLIMEVPRKRWADLRGKFGLSPSAEMKERFETFEKNSSSVAVKDLVKLFGPPNLYWEEAPGTGTMFYFWLTGSRFKFKIREGKIDGFERTYVHEE